MNYNNSNNSRIKKFRLIQDFKKVRVSLIKQLLQIKINI